MLELFVQFFEVAAIAVWKAVVALGIPIIIFSLLAVIVKGRAAVKGFYTSLPNSKLNFQLLVFNSIFIIPFIIFFRNYSPFIPKILPEFWVDLPNYVVIFCAAFAGDFIGYWRHRLEHIRWLWPFHAVHHSDEEMTWLTLERFHPVNRLTTYFIDNSFLVLLGIPLYAILASNVIRHYYGYFIHADLPFTYGKFIGKVFVSPNMHRWHHANVPSAYNTNYATIFSLFDRWFGTYRVPGLCDIQLGVDNEMGKGISGQLVYGLKPEAYK